MKYDRADMSVETSWPLEGVALILAREVGSGAAREVGSSGALFSLKEEHLRLLGPAISVYRGGPPFITYIFFFVSFWCLSYKTIVVLNRVVAGNTHELLLVSPHKYVLLNFITCRVAQITPV